MKNLRVNHYYSKVEWLNICKKYTYISAHNKEVLFFIDWFRDILKELESIENDLSKAKI